MNFRQPPPGFCTREYFWTAACGVLVMLLLAPAAPAASSIPLEVRTNPSAAGSKELIDTFIKSQVDQLSAVATVHDARQALIDQVVSVGGQQLSPAFLDLYSQELNAQLMSLLSNPDQTVRLNVAIIVADVAEKADNDQLLPITLQLLKDKSDAVLIWALRAAKFVLPQAILANREAPLVAAIKVQAGQNANPMLLQLVYEAFCPPLRDPASSGKIVLVVVPELQTLLAARVEQFRVEVPPDLLSVVPATNYLCNNDVWQPSGPTLQLKTVQILVDLISLAGERADASTGLEKQQLIGIVQRVSDGLKAVAYNVNATQVYTALTHQLIIKPNMTNISAITAQIQPTVTMFPDWKNITPPPHIVAGNAGASTAPTTSTETTGVTAEK